MNPGSLRERIEIQKSTETRSALGEVTQEWAAWATRFASVATLSSKQVLNAEQNTLRITHKVRLRYLDGLKSTYRIKWRNRILQIVSVLEHANFTVHELLCEEKE